MLFRSESVSITSSFTSPLTDSMNLCDKPKDLNLDKVKTCTESPMDFDEKAYLDMINMECCRYGFKCLSTSCPNINTFLSFKCPQGHSFSENYNETRKFICPNCQNRLEKCEEYAKLHNGIVKNTFRKIIKYDL